MDITGKQDNVKCAKKLKADVARNLKCAKSSDALGKRNARRIIKWNTWNPLNFKNPRKKLGENCQIPQVDFLYFMLLPILFYHFYLAHFILSSFFGAFHIIIFVLFFCAFHTISFLSIVSRQSFPVDQFSNIFCGKICLYSMKRANVFI